MKKQILLVAVALVVAVAAANAQEPAKPKMARKHSSISAKDAKTAPVTAQPAKKADVKEAAPAKQKAGGK